MRDELRGRVEDADLDVDPRVDEGEQRACNHAGLDLRQRDEEEGLQCDVAPRSCAASSSAALHADSEASVVRIT